ncbi:MAG: hypothetical protein QOK48_57 [Blastocatellia bacterium]|jgi:hypothetical protein|nr:hypothetical protein [Blastocatellia bacterium]
MVARGKREARGPWVGAVRGARTNGARRILIRTVIQARRDLTVACTWLPSARAFGANIQMGNSPLSSRSLT